MKDQELGDALLNWDARTRTGGIDSQQPHEQVAQVLERDQRRVRRLTVGTLVLWLLSAVGIPLFFALFCIWVMPKVVQITQEVITHSNVTDANELADQAEIVSRVTLKLSIVLVTASVAALLLAGGCTVWLVFATRRATLREVNANLAEIAAQLRRLAPPGSGGASKA